MHPFITLMKKIEGAGTFSAYGALEPILPGIRIRPKPNVRVTNRHLDSLVVPQFHALNQGYRIIQITRLYQYD